MKRGYIYLLATLVFLALAYLPVKVNLKSDDQGKPEIRRIEKRLKREFSILNKECKQVIAAIMRGGLNEALRNAKYPYFVFQKKKLLIWSDYHMVPVYEEITDIDDYKVIDLKGNILLVKKESFIYNGDSLTCTAFIPLHIKYPFNNKYLKSGLNPDIFRGINIRISDVSNGTDIKLQDKALFGVILFGTQTSTIPFLQLLFFMGGIVCLFLFIRGVIRNLEFHRKPASGFALFSLILILIRLSMVALRIPFAFVGLDFFDARFYASSFLNPSYGDLFLNVLVFWAITYYLFTRYYKFRITRKLLSSGQIVRDFASLILLSALFFGGFLIYKLVLSISTHSQWTLDITENLEFGLFRMSSYILFFISTISYILISSIAFNLLYRIVSRGRLLIITSVYFIFIFVLFYLLEPESVWVFFLIWMYILIIRVFNIPGKLSRVQYATFLYFAITTILSSSLGSLGIFHHHTHKVNNEKERYASRLFQQNDFIAEYYLSEAIRNIKDDVFIKTRIHSAFSSKDIIRDKINRVYLSNYFEKYDVTVLLFNSRGNSFEPNVALDYHEFKKRYALEDLHTEYNNLYLINANQPGSPTRYLAFMEIERFSSVVGYILINLRLKKVIRASVFPKLLVDDRFDLSEAESSFGYVMYKNGRLITQSGDHGQIMDRRKLIESPKIFKKGIVMGDFSYLGFKDSNDNVVLISSEKYSWRNISGNFSFLFCVYSLVSLVVLVIFAIVYQMGGRNLNYATRIQLFLNIAFIIPLIAVSITTLTRLSRDYNKELDARYRQTAENLAMSISPFLANYVDDEDRRDKEELARELSVIASFAGCDVNLFGIGNQKGKLITSTQPLIYDRGVLSKYINPVAGREIYANSHNQLVVSERTGEIKYKSAYTAIQSAGTGKLLGILSIPFFSSEQEIDARISDLLVNILNIFTIIFILFLIISYFTSFYLIQPLQLLIQKIRRTSLEGENEPLRYQSNDEIGQIVSEYNKMLIKLKESRKALAKTEKESAWKEMARQVAHEIKNPLTPMKLTIQHLGMRLKDKKDPESQALGKSLNSLLHNIDTLSGIASSFSTYAQMPVPEIEEFDVEGLLKKTTGLYSTEGKARIILELPGKEIKIKGDPNWLGRAFSNLIINGIQAVDSEKEAMIKVRLVELDESKILISFEDNGVGIAENISDKIFMPNFSTKYSGSGIGLAVTKRAVDHTNGKIWFETNIGVGTTFFVELPLSD